jgi:hypothetical protein
MPLGADIYTLGDYVPQLEMEYEVDRRLSDRGIRKFSKRRA